MELRKCSQITYFFGKRWSCSVLYRQKQLQFIAQDFDFLRNLSRFLTVSNDNALCLLLPVPSAGCLGWWNRKAEYEIPGSWGYRGICARFSTLREIPSPLDGITLYWKTPANPHTHRSAAPRLLKGIFLPTFLFSLNLLWRIFFFLYTTCLTQQQKGVLFRE